MIRSKGASLLVGLLSALCLVACSESESDGTTLTVWHFWSEPHQAIAMQALAKDFEARNPGVHVELVALQWSDGKAKLQMALSTAERPDVVHVGLDWFSEFARYDVFEPSTSELSVTWREAISYADSARATPWTMNCRALLVRHGGTSRRVGLCTSDPHNVLKRTLPLLWRQSSTTFCRSTPIHETMDDACVDALDELRRTVQRGNPLGRSRDLDDMFIRGQIDTVISGMWMIDRVLPLSDSVTVIPVRSLINADVLAVPRKRNTMLAHAFVAFVTQHNQMVSFCQAVPEAGFPIADSTAAAVVATVVHPRARALFQGFRETLLSSIPMPTSPQTLAIESELEELVDRCLNATSRADVRSLVEASRLRVATLE